MRRAFVSIVAVLTMFVFASSPLAAEEISLGFAKRH